jgi:hypothetical protein
MRQTDTRFDVDTALIRPAVELTLVHALEQRPVDAARLAGVKDAGYSTHSFSVPGSVNSL